jgi:membrane protein DedA with SNARE-associated domain
MDQADGPRPAEGPAPAEGPQPADGPAPDRNRFVKAYAWVLHRWPESTRRRAALVVAFVALLVGTFIASARLLELVFDDLDNLAYVGLFVTCWIGAGGALVPIPGVRVVSLIMIVQQAAALDPLITIAVAASAMTLGQLSWYAAARAGAARTGAARTGGTTDSAPAAGPAAAPPSAPTGRRAALAARSQRAAARVATDLRAHDVVTVFAASAVPTPLSSIAASSAGALRIPLARYLLASFAGRITLCAVLAVFGQAIATIIDAIT